MAFVGPVLHIPIVSPHAGVEAVHIHTAARGHEHVIAHKTCGHRAAAAQVEIESKV